MKQFMDQNFLLSNDTAQKLYFDNAANTPVLDYHCHINPQEIYVIFPYINDIYISKER